MKIRHSTKTVTMSLFLIILFYFYFFLIILSQEKLFITNQHAPPFLKYS